MERRAIGEPGRDQSSVKMHCMHTKLHAMWLELRAAARGHVVLMRVKCQINSLQPSNFNESCHPSHTSHVENDIETQQKRYFDSENPHTWSIRLRTRAQYYCTIVSRTPKNRPTTDCAAAAAASLSFPAPAGRLGAASMWEKGRRASVE